MNLDAEALVAQLSKLDTTMHPELKKVFAYLDEHFGDEPCAIIGGEETNPLLYRFDRLAELLKLPYLPVTPTFPWLGPLGLIPAPARWKIRFGEPLSFDSYGPEAADDDVLVGRLSERVRGSIQGLLDTGLRERKSVWFG